MLSLGNKTGKFYLNWDLPRGEGWEKGLISEFFSAGVIKWLFYIFSTPILIETFGKWNVFFLHTCGRLWSEELMVCGSLYPTVLLWQRLGWWSVTAVLIISRALQFRPILGSFPVSWKQRHCQECQAFAAGSTHWPVLGFKLCFSSLDVWDKASGTFDWLSGYYWDQRLAFVCLFDFFCIRLLYSTTWAGLFIERTACRDVKFQGKLNDPASLSIR